MSLRVDDWNEVTRETYNKYAKEFDRFARIFRGRSNQFIEYFAAQIKTGGNILDVGCGAGRDALCLTKKGFKLTGIDFSEELIKIAKKKVKDGKFLAIDFEEMTFSNNSFDGVWANASLVHIPKERLLPVLKKLYKVLKNSGAICVSLRYGEGERFTKERRGGAMLKRFYAYYQLKEAVAIVEKAGFADIKYEVDDVGRIARWIWLFAKKL